MKKAKRKFNKSRKAANMGGPTVRKSKRLLRTEQDGQRTVVIAKKLLPGLGG